MIFIDLEKAFDEVPRGEVWKSPENREVSRRIINLIENVYGNNGNHIINNNAKLDRFKIGLAPRQGGGFSPTLTSL